MRKTILLVGFASVFLAGCNTVEQPAPVVVAAREQTNVQVPPITKPAPFSPARFKFAKPDSPNAIVSLDYKNYNMFQEFMLGINRREIDWDSRLTQANSSILLLQGVQEVKPSIPTK